MPRTATRMVHLHVLVPADLLERIDQVAAEEDRSRSGVVRHFVQRALAGTAVKESA